MNIDEKIAEYKASIEKCERACEETTISSIREVALRKANDCKQMVEWLEDYKRLSSSEKANNLQESGGGTMTLDEAIRHAEYVAREKESEANFGFGNVCIDRSSCLKCAEEHKQLARWLRELKKYRAESGGEE